MYVPRCFLPPRFDWPRIVRWSSHMSELLDTDFIIPAKPSDLESAGSGWRVCSPVEPTAGLEDLLLANAERIKEEPATIASQSTFDLMYSAVRSFASLPADAQRATCELCTVVVQQAAKAAKRALVAQARDRELAQWRALLKAAAYLLTWLVQEAEKVQAIAADAALAAKPARGRGGGKKAASAREADTFQFEEYREPAALRMLEALELDLSELWSHRAPEEPFLALFAKVAYAILEQSSALKASSASLKEALWRLIALPTVARAEPQPRTGHGHPCTTDGMAAPLPSGRRCSAARVANGGRDLPMEHPPQGP